MRKLKTQEVIDQFIKVHGDKYIFEKFVYYGTAMKSVVTCKKHGDFEIRPRDLKSGKGCSHCGGNAKGNTETFIKKAIKVHGSKYDYSMANYTGAMKKVKIICSEHGKFSQAAIRHLKGQGCPHCSSTKLNNEIFIKRAIEVHGSKYDYSQLDYKNDRTKVKIICSVHGSEFLQRPSVHLSGQGCSSCNKSGFNHSRKSSFYIQKLFDKDDNFIAVKIGITNKSANTRMREHSSQSIYRHELLTVIRDSGKIVFELERIVKERFSKFRSDILKENMKDGYTETFTAGSLFMIHSLIMTEYERILS